VRTCGSCCSFPSPSSSSPSSPAFSFPESCQAAELLPPSSQTAKRFLLESPQAVPESLQAAEQRYMHRRDAEGERGHAGAFAKPLPQGGELIAVPPPSSLPRLLARASAFYRHIFICVRECLECELESLPRVKGTRFWAG
jgi:hypothetical protein